MYSIKPCIKSLVKPSSLPKTKVWRATKAVKAGLPRLQWVLRRVPAKSW